MTPGQEALREAARLESSRVYGQVHREHREPKPVHAPPHTTETPIVDITAARQRKRPA